MEPTGKAAGQPFALQCNYGADTTTVAVRAIDTAAGK